MNAGGGFPSLDEVRGNGSMLVKTSTLAEAGTRTMLFPSMNFTCNGTITKLTFLAANRISSFFHLGRVYSQVDNYTYLVDPHTEDLSIDGAVPIDGSVTGYELNYESGEIPFQAGDVLGLQQSPLYYLLHQMGERMETCDKTWSPMRKNFICTVGGDIDRPLMAVETGML